MEPQDAQRDPKGSQKSQHETKIIQREKYISKKSRSTAQADVMLSDLVNLGGLQADIKRGLGGGGWIPLKNNITSAWAVDREFFDIYLSLWILLVSF